MKKLSYIILFIISFFRSYTQILIPNTPDVKYLGATGTIHAFEFDSVTNKLYIAGEFDTVGTSAKSGFAVIDLATGNVLADFDSLSITNGNFPGMAPTYNENITMQIVKRKLYVGGAFNSFVPGTGSVGCLFSLDLDNGSAANISNIPLASIAISDFQVYNNKIYTTGSYQLGWAAEYMVTEQDSIGNIFWQKSISNGAGDALKTVAVKNSNLFIGGFFSSFDLIPLNNIVKVDLITHTSTTWTLNPLPGNSPATCFGVNNISLINNDVWLNIDKASCANPTWNLISYDIVSGINNNFNASFPWQADFKNSIIENDTSFWYFEFSGLKLYGLTNYVSPWSPTTNATVIESFFRRTNYLFIAGNFTSLEGVSHAGLGIYCLKPLQPIIQTSTPTVCRLQNNVNYAVASDYKVSSYSWSYTGAGVTIIGSGSSVSLNFSSTATSGNLNVVAQNSCGAMSSVLSILIIVNPLPNVNAGPDINFTCAHTTDSLLGSSLSSGVSYNWVGPSYSNGSPIGAFVSPGAVAGIYSLTVTYIATGCADIDTAKITYDTLKPVINHLVGTYLLTCATNSLTLDASANYPVNDSLHWTASLFSQNNPASINILGTYFLTVTSGINGCKNIDSVIVTSSATPPNLSLAFTKDTITCLKDSIQLQASSSNPNVVISWTDTSNNVLLNNSFVNQPEVYVAHALDTTNGCPAQNTLNITTFLTPPAISITPGNNQLNCSYNTVTLNGSSLTPGATLQWTGPLSFSSANPATVNQTGYYFLTVTDSNNGCTKKDSVNVTQQNVLALNVTANTTICNGSSTTLTVSPIGGTPGFAYLWSNSAGNSSSVSVSPTDTAIYIVTVSDNAGCVGSDTVKINVPDVVSDSVSTFIPCDPNHPNGQIQAFAKGGILPYTYSLNGGVYQPSGVFPNLNFGTYTVSVRDGWGCSFVATSTIDSTSILPSPDFILSTTEIKGDTFVIVDISNPRPDSVFWILPAGCQIINTNSFAPKIINSDTGALQITMSAWFGTCNMNLTKNIHVIKYDTVFATDHNNNGIKSITLYPNPNTGIFTVDIELYKSQTFAIFIYDALSNELLRLSCTNLNFMSAPINLTGKAPGTYLLKVIAEYDSKSKTFLISQ